jgi:hypothetical protein
MQINRWVLGTSSPAVTAHVCHWTNAFCAPHCLYGFPAELKAFHMQKMPRKAGPYVHIEL